MEKFRVAQVEVDAKRGLLRVDGQVKKLEPRVMDLLCFMAQHPGEVFSAEQLFEQVWPVGVFNPSSVQRCIALLRQNLGQKDAGQTFIQTYPKRGYALLAPVTELRQQKRNIITPGTLSLRAVFVLLVVVLIWQFWPQSEPDKLKGQLSLLSTVTNNESRPNLSLDGTQLIWLRQTAAGNFQIWKKQRDTGLETLLLENPQPVLFLAWLNKTVYYVERVEDELRAWQLSAQEQKQLVTKVKIQGQVDSAQLTRSKLYFLQQLESDVSQLVEHDYRQHLSRTLLQTEPKLQLQNIALSRDETQLALVQQVGANSYQLKQLSLTTGEVRVRAAVEGLIFDLTWGGDNQQLLFSQQNNLYQLNAKGDISTLPINQYQYINHMQYLAHKQQLVMTLNDVDMDIWQWDAAKAEMQKRVDTRSLDILPLVSPTSHQFLYQSRREGRMQLWLRDGTQDRLLFDNPQKQELFGYSWSRDGKRVAMATAHKVYLFEPETGQQTQYPLRQNKLYIRGWFGGQETLLVNVRQGGLVFPAALSLADMQLTVLSQEPLSCAVIDANNQLYAVRNNRELVTIHQTGIQPLFALERGRIEELVATGEQLYLQQAQSEQSHIWLWQQGQLTKVLDSDYYLASVAQAGPTLFFTSPPENKSEIALLE